MKIGDEVRLVIREGVIGTVSSVWTEGVWVKLSEPPRCRREIGFANGRQFFPNGSVVTVSAPAVPSAIFYCPRCRKQHIDENEFATRVHRTRRCVDDSSSPAKGCGFEWKIDPPVFGAMATPVPERYICKCPLECACRK